MIRSIIVALLALFVALPGRAPVLFTEQEQREIWAGIQKEYPECKNKQQPEVIYTNKLDNLGVYFPYFKLIQLRTNVSSKVLEHEYRHACGDPYIQ